MIHQSRSLSSSRGRRRAAVFAVAFVVLALLLAYAVAAGAGPRGIFATDTTPNYALNVNGSGASIDAAMSVVAVSGGAWVAGWAGNAAGNADATIMKVTATGSVGPLKRYDGGKNDAFAKIVKGPKDTLYTAGWTLAGNNKTNILVVKWSKAGKKLWSKTYDGPAHGNDAATGIGVDSTGNVTVAGGSDGAHGTDCVVVKWSAKGAKLFAWRYDGAGKLDDAATDVTVAADGTTYVTGNTKVSGGMDGALTVKFSPAGKKAWQKVYLGTNSLGAGSSAVAPRAKGGVYIAGWTQVGVGNKDGLVLRYTASGSAQVLPPSAAVGDQWFNDVAVTTAKSIAAVGENAAIGAGQAHVRLWSSDSAAPIGPDIGGAWEDAFTAVAADSLGAFCYTGWNRTAAVESETITYRIKLLPSSPTAGFSGSWSLGPNYCNGYAIAIDGATVYVAGSGYKDAAEGYNQTVVIYAY